MQKAQADNDAIGQRAQAQIRQLEEQAAENSETIRELCDEKGLMSVK